MHLTGGILRHFRALSTLEQNPALEVLSTPAHPQVTPTVRPPCLLNRWQVNSSKADSDSLQSGVEWEYIDVMKGSSSPETALFSLRTAIGLLTGIAASLVFGILFNRLFEFAPVMSILTMMMVSNSYAIKRIAGLAALVGFITGLVAGLKDFLLNLGNAGLVGLIAIYRSRYSGVILYCRVCFRWLLFGKYCRAL